MRTVRRGGRLRPCFDDPAVSTRRVLPSNAGVQLQAHAGATPKDRIAMPAGARILNPLVRQLQRHVRRHGGLNRPDASATWCVAALPEHEDTDRHAEYERARRREWPVYAVRIVAPGVNGQAEENEARQRGHEADDARLPHPTNPRRRRAGDGARDGARDGESHRIGDSEKPRVVPRRSAPDRLIPAAEKCDRDEQRTSLWPSSSWTVRRS